MNKRNIIATVAGIVLAFAIVLVFDAVGKIAFPLPFKLDTTSRDAMLASIEANIHLIPFGSFLSMIIGHMLGVFFGMKLAQKMSKESNLPALIVAGLILISAIVQSFLIPHPGWFIYADVAAILIGIGAAYFWKKKK